MFSCVCDCVCNQNEALNDEIGENSLIQVTRKE